MSNFQVANELAAQAYVSYQAAYAEYMAADGSRELTIKQGVMQAARRNYHAALEYFFEEFQKED